MGGMSAERQRITLTGASKEDPVSRGVCEGVPTGVELTQEDLYQAAQTFGDKAEWGHATSNGLFIGCTLCGQTVQLTVGDKVERDRFCEAAIAARNATKQTEPTTPEQAKPID